MIRIIETTVGRVILFEALPEGSDFNWVNKVMTKSDLPRLVERVYYRFGAEDTVKCLDSIKKLGFYHSTIAGISFSIDNLIVPAEKILLLIKLKKKFKKLNSSTWMVLSPMVNVIIKC